MVRHAPFVDETHIDQPMNRVGEYGGLTCFLLQTGIVIISTERFNPAMI